MTDPLMGDTAIRIDDHSQIVGCFFDLEPIVLREELFGVLPLVQEMLWDEILKEQRLPLVKGVGEVFTTIPRTIFRRDQFRDTEEFLNPRFIEECSYTIPPEPDIGCKDMETSVSPGRIADIDRLFQNPFVMVMTVLTEDYFVEELSIVLTGVNDIELFEVARDHDVDPIVFQDGFVTFGSEELDQWNVDLVRIHFIFSTTAETGHVFDLLQRIGFHVTGNVRMDEFNWHDYPLL
jgi:hypothetical protein